MSRRLEALVLLAAVVSAGLVSIRLGQDANWDLMNYHLYNPWAWLTGRYGHDLAPAQLQTFHNPLLDVPLFLMVEAQWRPRVIAFALAIPAGVTLYFAWRIAWLAFARLDRPLAVTAAVAAVALGATGPNAVSMLGTTMNEWQVAALLAPALWLVARDIAAGTLHTRTLVVAGLLAGAASGLKLTGAGYALALAVTLVAVRGPRRGFAEAAIYGFAVLAGLAVTLGPWMAKVHALTGNPVFPYFNALFGSTLLSADWSFHKAYGPTTAAQWLTLPFDLLRPPRGYVSEQRYRDARLPVLAALGLVALLAPLLLHAIGRQRPASAFDALPGERALLRFGAVFFVVAFALWAWLHAIHRYLLLLEVLSGIGLVALVVAGVPQRARVAAVIALSAAIVFSTRVPSWWRVPYGDAFLAVEAPAIGPGSLVLTVGGPVAFVLPAFPPDARFAGIGTNLVNHGPSGLKQAVRERVDAQRGEIHALAVRGEDTARWLDEFGLVQAGPCQEVRHNLGTFRLDLCPLARR